MTCPKCGSREIDDVVVDQDPLGNDIRAIVCGNPDCDPRHVYYEQGYTSECLHLEWERDEIGRYWCAECGNYLGERSPHWYAKD